LTEIPRAYWVVSPNVRNNEDTVDAWRRASVIAGAAFYGVGSKQLGEWPNRSQVRGKKNVESSRRHNMIARRHRFDPEMLASALFAETSPYASRHQDASKFRVAAMVETIHSLDRETPKPYPDSRRLSAIPGLGSTSSRLGRGSSKSL